MRILVSKGDTTLILKGNNLKYEVIKNGYSWVGQGRRPHIFFQKKMFGKYLWLPKAINWASKVEHKIEGDCIISKFSGYRVMFKKLSLSITVTAKLLEDGKVDFSINAENESGMDIKAIYFPQPFNAKEYDTKKAYSVDPMRQGVMLPDKHKANWQQIFLMTKYWRRINTGDAFMPVWGRVCDGKGYVGMMESSYDASLFSCYGKKVSFLTSANWFGSLGKLSYERTVHYHFYDSCDYITIAKAFRQQEKEQGNLITIDDKIKKNPKVANLIGAPIIHWRVLENTVPVSKFYIKGGENTVLHYTFDRSAEIFQQFKSLGLEKAYVHTDGWGNHGYDNLHPYALPPNAEAGGWEGMRNLTKSCREMGWTFAIHDQYRDFYHDCSMFDADKCVVDINGKKAFCDVWAGGAHNWLCTKFALDFVKKTYTELMENGVLVDGTYLDVFGIVLGDECYDPKHPLTRKESIDMRGECFEYLQSLGLIVSSEEIGTQMVKYLDLVHHAPYSLTPQETGVAVGIPIPFANLVYHDCVFVPWFIEGKGGWGIPNGDSGKMHCILNGQTPYFSSSMEAYKEETESQIIFRINECNEVAAINRLVYNAEMVSHKFLDGSYRIQQTQYSNGYKITVDFDKDTYKIEK